MKINRILLASTLGFAFLATSSAFACEHSGSGGDQDSHWSFSGFSFSWCHHGDDDHHGDRDHHHHRDHDGDGDHGGCHHGGSNSGGGSNGGSGSGSGSGTAGGGKGISG